MWLLRELHFCHLVPCHRHVGYVHAEPTYNNKQFFSLSSSLPNTTPFSPPQPPTTPLFRAGNSGRPGPNGSASVGPGLNGPGPLRPGPPFTPLYVKSGPHAIEPGLAHFLLLLLLFFKKILLLNSFFLFQHCSPCKFYGFSKIKSSNNITNPQ